MADTADSESAALGVRVQVLIRTISFATVFVSFSNSSFSSVVRSFPFKRQSCCGIQACPPFRRSVTAVMLRSSVVEHALLMRVHGSRPIGAPILFRGRSSIMGVHIYVAANTVWAFFQVIRPPVKGKWSSSPENKDTEYAVYLPR